MIYVTQFRKNDLNPSKGRQIEFNKTVIDEFFKFTESESSAEFVCRSLSDHTINEKIKVQFKLSSDREDYKIYQNKDGSKDLKDFFIKTLQLNAVKNGEDYFAIRKVNASNYTLYYIPKDSLFSSFFPLISGDQILFVTEDTKERIQSLFSFQRIYYGAPGTGKSHSVNELTDGESVIRTTFHPDSDYSTFVGAYKPTMGKTVENMLSVDELKEKLHAQKSKPDGYPCHIFAVQYWYSLSKLNVNEINNILVDCGFTKSMCKEIYKGIAIGKRMSDFKRDKIMYEFVAQAFLQAYVHAWKNYAEAEDGKPKKQFLVVEEINRGNCAQIFGDLFQLLDRNDSGFSEYPINADKDLQTYLAKEFEGMGIRQKDNIDGMYKTNVVDKVVNGEILLLPNNLYIWATMNTSDQSLFPIDSAFKRRWDWMYVPIANAAKGWKIDVGKGVYYDWWDFLEKINRRIYATTNSADKQLGYFFCKADENKVISAETFVNKVIFYLWNDVFKDYGFDDNIFDDKSEKKVQEKSKLTFDKFFREDSLIKVANFLDNLEVEKMDNAVIDDGTSDKNEMPD